MAMEYALLARLTGNAAVAALVGDRVSWIERPAKDALPAITLQTVLDARPMDYAGRDRRRPGYVQIDAWAADYVQMKSLKDAIMTAIGEPAVTGGVRFSRATFEARELPERDGEETIFRASIDARFHFIEP